MRMRGLDPLFPPLFINADDIAKKDKLSAYEAAVEADRRRNDAILRRLSFATETVMSTETKIDFYCGDELQKQATQSGLDSCEGGSGLAMPHHYRAGHWTHQVWGPALSLRKLIWLMPIEVNRDKNVPKRAGHVYFVD